MFGMAGFFRLRFVTLALATIISAGCTANSIAQESFYDPDKYHHMPDGFRNLPGSLEREHTPFRFLRFFFKRLAKEYSAPTLPEGHVLPRAETLRQFAAVNSPRLTWIGHATFLISMDGLNILTDPFFSERASPFTFAGPKRYVAPALEIDDLPAIDVIVISHNHYDSFDLPALKKLATRTPETLVLVPLGLGSLVREAGFTNFHEMDWYDEAKVKDVTFTSTPTIHWSRRTLTDTNQTLWTGFMITGPSRKIWFVGDTGFGPAFERDIAPRVGPADIAIVPIGAFLPRDFMRPMHTTPAEALKLARIMGARVAVAMHWGTVQLGEDTPRQGMERFLAANEPGVTKKIMRIGESIDLGAL